MYGQSGEIAEILIRTDFFGPSDRRFLVNRETPMLYVTSTTIAHTGSDQTTFHVEEQNESLLINNDFKVRSTSNLFLHGLERENCVPFT
jgi:hypothetical protein